MVLETRSESAAQAQDPGSLQVGADAGHAGSLAGDLEALRGEVERGRRSREALEDELVLMRSVIDAMLGLGAEAGASDLAFRSEGEGDDADEPTSDTKAASSPGRFFDDGRLGVIGVDPGEIDRLRDDWEASQLKQLELANEATREGWLMTPRHRQALRDLRWELRSELGEEGYDRMLYATQQPNRTVVRDVLSRSQASRVGIQPGDHILRYGDQRIYAPRELNIATAAGERGDPVRVEVLRDGRTLDLWLERGPIGVMIEHEQATPGSS